MGGTVSSRNRHPSTVVSNAQHVSSLQLQQFQLMCMMYLLICVGFHGRQQWRLQRRLVAQLPRSVAQPGHHRRQRLIAICLQHTVQSATMCPGAAQCCNQR